MSLAQRIESLPPEKRKLFEALAAREREKKRQAAGAPAPLVRRPPAAEYPLSFDQERLWFIHQLEPASSAYNIDAAMRLTGRLDVRALFRAVARIVERHKIWRTVFPLRDGRPVQVIEPARPLPLPVIDFSEVPTPDAAALGRLSLTEAHRPFDLARGPLVRLTLLRLGPTSHLLLLTVHHIVTDWFSFHLFWAELAALYPEFAAGGRPRLPELPVDYVDFVLWHRERFSDEALARYLDFWTRELADFPHVLELPTDRPRPNRFVSQGRKRPVVVDRARADALKALGGREGASLFMTVLALYSTLLGRFAGQDRLLVSSPNANRGAKELEPVIGFFLTQLVYACDLSGGPSFRDMLRRLRSWSLAMFPHADLPFSKLVEALQPERDPSRPPLVQASLLLLDAEFSRLALPGLGIEPLLIDDQAARYDLALAIWDTAEGQLRGSLEYNLALFDGATAERLVASFQQLVDGVLADPDLPLARQSLLPPALRHQLLLEDNDRHAPLPPEPWAHRRVAARAAAVPEAVAVEGAAELVSYGELARRTAALARRLAGHGVGPEAVVGLTAPRSPDLVAGMLAVLEAGGAFLLLDPSLPQERRRLMIEDAGVGLVAAGGGVPAPDGPEAVELAAPPATGGGESAAAAAALAATEPDALGLAYLFFTSGSTGRPKGVAMGHGNLAAFIDFASHTFSRGPETRMLWSASLAFDATVAEVLAPLIAGGRVVLAPPAGARDPRRLSAWMAERRITSLLGVPSFLQLLAAENDFAAVDGLEQIIAGGEALPGELARRLAAPGRRVMNTYGPTETTVYCTLATPGQTTAPGEPPLGPPNPGVLLMVVDRRLELSFAGAPGELVIGGPTVTRGYVRRPALTAGRFVPDPFGAEAGQRLYRTGDRVRRRPDGGLEFLGRFDYQVKVRGIRVEPGEIESLLRQHPEVREAVVTVPADASGHRRLVAYVSGCDGARSVPDAEALRAHLARRLPESMLPSVFVALDEMPLGPQGKLDRRALPEPEIAAAGGGTLHSWAEQRLSAIWEGVLGVEGIGPQDSFFRLGGDSILSIQMIARAREAGLFLEAAEVFQHPTLRQLAAVARTAAASVAEQGPVTGPVPLTPIQRHFFAAGPAAPHHFNMVLLFLSPAELDAGRLERALLHLAAHHDALRLAFERQPGDGGTRLEERWRQVNRGLEALTGPTVSSLVVVRDLAAVAAADRPRLVEELSDRLQGSFDLARPPLVRAGVFRFGPGETGRLLLLAHHLAVDELSWRVLLEDLESAYRQLEAGRRPVLPAKTTSFREWAERLAKVAASGELGARLDGWLAPFAEGPVAAELPADVPDADDLEGDLEEVTFALGPDESGALLRRPAGTAGGGEGSAAVEVLLLAALARVLGRWTGRERLVIDVDGHGREDLFPGVDLSRTAGWFTSLYPLVLEAPAEGGAAAAIAAVGRRLAELPDRGVSFGVLRWLRGGEASQRLAALPRAQLVFNYLGRLREGEAVGAFRVAAEPCGRHRAPENRRVHRLEVDAKVAGGRLVVSWWFSRRRYRRETVEGLAAGMRRELEALAAEAAAGPSEGEAAAQFGWSAADLESIRGVIGEEVGEGVPEEGAPGEGALEEGGA